MKTERGVITVVYKKPGRTPRYLVLKRKKNWEGWETPKGHIENDDFEETVKLELQEEAGIREEEIEEIEDLEHVLSWEYEREGEKRKKEYRAFAVKVDNDARVKVGENPHDEHEKGFFFNYRDAKSLLTYEDNRQLLEMVQEQID